MGICFSIYTGAVLLKTYDKRTIIAVTSLFPLLLSIAASFLQETPVKYDNFQSHRATINQMREENISLLYNSYEV